MPRYKRRLMSDINMVPFIDIVLVLLVAFMVAAPLMMQGVQVNLPETDSSPLKATKDNTLVVTVKPGGEYYLNVGADSKQPVTLESLVDKVGKIKRRSPGIMVLVRGDRKTDYGHVVTVMAGLQRAGVSDVGLITEPRDLK